MSKHLIIATHASLAKGFVETMKFFCEPDCTVHTLCAFSEEGNPQVWIEETLESIPASDNLIVMTDLLSGSVNKLFATYLQDRTFHLIAGINLALLLELAMTKEELLDEDFIRRALEMARSEMVYVNDELKTNRVDSEEELFT